MRIIPWILAGLVLVFALIQGVPYGRAHDNPPVVSTPSWDGRTQALAERACWDCHSNETVWPWYANVAPVSWLVQSDVDRGREKLNFSEWGREEQEAGGLSETVTEGEMPPRSYPLLHPSARLTDAERGELAAGLARLSPPGGEGEEQGED